MEKIFAEAWKEEFLKLLKVNMKWKCKHYFWSQLDFVLHTYISTDLFSKLPAVKL